jgi:ATP-dependent RNA helicase HelY
VRTRFSELRRIADDLAADEETAGLTATRPPDAGFVHLAHPWAAGDGLASVLEDEELSGGDFVRNVKQLIDLLRGIGDIAPVPATAARARQAAAALHRGVVTASSAIEVDEVGGEPVADLQG